MKHEMDGNGQSDCCADGHHGPALKLEDALARILAEVKPVSGAETMALREALGGKFGIERYGFVVPMDESEARVSIDLSGRARFAFKGTFPTDSVGQLSTEMVQHFFLSLSDALGAALHIEVTGENAHHMVEACFKAVGRALGQAIRRSGDSLPSTKGTLS